MTFSEVSKMKVLTYDGYEIEVSLELVGQSSETIQNMMDAIGANALTDEVVPINVSSASLNAYLRLLEGDAPAEPLDLIEAANWFQDTTALDTIWYLAQGPELAETIVEVDNPYLYDKLEASRYLSAVDVNVAIKVIYEDAYYYVFIDREAGALYNHKKGDRRTLRAGYDIKNMLFTMGSKDSEKNIFASTTKLVSTQELASEKEPKPIITAGPDSVPFEGSWVQDLSVNGVAQISPGLWSVPTYEMNVRIVQYNHTRHGKTAIIYLDAGAPYTAGTGYLIDTAFKATNTIDGPSLREHNIYLQADGNIRQIPFSAVRYLVDYARDTIVGVNRGNLKHIITEQGRIQVSLSRSEESRLEAVMNGYLIVIHRRNERSLLSLIPYICNGPEAHFDYYAFTRSILDVMSESLKDMTALSKIAIGHGSSSIVWKLVGHYRSAVVLADFSSLTQKPDLVDSVPVRIMTTWDVIEGRGDPKRLFGDAPWPVVGWAALERVEL